MAGQSRRRAGTARTTAPEAAKPATPARRRRAAAAAPPAAPAVALAQEVAISLEKARVGLDAAMMRFAERVGGELDRVRAQVASEPPPATKVLERIKARLEEVRLKPQKGRVKDFARLEDLAEDLGDLVPQSMQG